MNFSIFLFAFFSEKSKKISKLRKKLENPIFSPKMRFHYTYMSWQHAQSEKTTKKSFESVRNGILFYLVLLVMMEEEKI
jgi:hypothetical protein